MRKLNKITKISEREFSNEIFGTYLITLDDNSKIFFNALVDFEFKISKLFLSYEKRLSTKNDDYKFKLTSHEEFLIDEIGSKEQQIIENEFKRHLYEIAIYLINNIQEIKTRNI